MKILITGGCGFIGSNLASKILERKDELIVFDNLSRFGGCKNLAWLDQHGKFTFMHGDVRSVYSVNRLVKQFKPDVIFHLAGQVAMTTSLDNPRLDFETNVLGTFNILEAAKEHVPECIILYSSTNKVYGDLEHVQYKEMETRYWADGFAEGFDEQLPLQFTTPYGCSKGAADQYVLDYHKMFDLRTVVFRHSSVFGGRQFSTYDQGWVGWFINQALETIQNPSRPPFTISGNGKQVRDILFIDDLAQCYFNAVENIDYCCGQAFNIGGGINNSISLLELLLFLEKKMGVNLNYQKIPWRQSDQKVFVANVKKAKQMFGWEPKISKEDGLQRMIEWAAQYAV